MLSNKTCPKCGINKPAEDYYKTTGGLHSRCKDCARQEAADYRDRNPHARKAWADKNKTRVAQYNAKQTKTNPYAHRKAAAKRREIPFLLTKEDFKNLTAEDKCGICNKPFEVGVSGRQTIDRLDNNGPYSLENCWAVCGSCNMKKRNLSIFEMRHLLTAIEARYRAAPPNKHRLVAVDPGKKNAGVAEFVDSKLVRCTLCVGDGPFDTARAVAVWVDPGVVDDLVIEGQFVYPGPRRANPNDLIPLSQVVGGVAAGIKHIFFHNPRPRDWKGSTPKAIFTARTEAALSSDECALVDRLDLPRSLRHNVLDAIALGKWFLGLSAAEDD